MVWDVEVARREGKAFAHDIPIIPGTPEARALIESLPNHVRDLVGSLQRVIYLRWRDRIYLVTGGC